MNDDELQDMREAALLLMNDVATIQRPTEVQDGLDTTTVFTDHLINVPCRMAERDSQGDRELVVGGRIASVGEHLVRFPYGTDVHESDRIKIRINRQDRTFEVARVLEHSYATTTSVACSEVR